MSTFIIGVINVESILPFHEDTAFVNSMMKLCLNEGFAINFQCYERNQVRAILENDFQIPFLISDSLLISYCEGFMEPIYYPIGEIPTFDVLKKDIKKIKNLIKLILSNDYVEDFDLYSSSGDCIKADYKRRTVGLNEFEEVLFQEYVNANCIPDLRLKVRRTLSD